MAVLDAVRKLGEELQKDERFIKYAKAKLAVDSDAELQGKISEFNIVRMNLERETGKDDRDEEKIKQYNENLRQIYSQVMTSKTMNEFNTAKAQLDSLLHDIDSVIMQCADGADPATCEPEAHNCSGSCSTCGGCH